MPSQSGVLKRSKRSVECSNGQTSLFCRQNTLCKIWRNSQRLKNENQENIKTAWPKGVPDKCELKEWTGRWKFRDQISWNGRSVNVLSVFRSNPSERFRQSISSEDLLKKRSGSDWNRNVQGDAAPVSSGILSSLKSSLLFFQVKYLELFIILLPKRRRHWLELSPESGGGRAPEHRSSSSSGMGWTNWVV